MPQLNSTVVFNVLVPIIFFAAFYFFIMLPQKKREKKIKDMRDAMKVGDEVVTIGGMVGRITKITEDQITIEVGADKTRLNFEKWGIGKVLEKENKTV